MGHPHRLRPGHSDLPPPGNVQRPVPSTPPAWDTPHRLRPPDSTHPASPVIGKPHHRQRPATGAQRPGRVDVPAALLPLDRHPALQARTSPVRAWMSRCRASATAAGPLRRTVRHRARTSPRSYRRCRSASVPARSALAPVRSAQAESPLERPRPPISPVPGRSAPTSGTRPPAAPGRGMLRLIRSEGCPASRGSAGRGDMIVMRLDLSRAT